MEDISFDLWEGETLALVGESGSGKTLTCLSILGLLPKSAHCEANGIFFRGCDILGLKNRELRKLRGKEIAYIFQDPMTALNPVFTVGHQLVESLLLHTRMSLRTARSTALEWLEKVRMPDPQRVYSSYPFMLSGGMRQRVLIAMALSCRPKLLIADEPSSALDASLQMQILSLINELKQDIHASCIFISHDLELVSHIADSIMVMYSGRICERANGQELFQRPMHPYTRGLIESIPLGNTPLSNSSLGNNSLGNNSLKKTGANRLQGIPGTVPSIRDKPEGCPFHPRCTSARPICCALFPPQQSPDMGHRVSCWAPLSERALAVPQIEKSRG